VAPVIVPRDKGIRPSVEEKLDDLRVLGVDCDMKGGLLPPLITLVRLYEVWRCKKLGNDLPFRLRRPDEQVLAKFWGDACIELRLENFMQSVTGEGECV
jgi:hypothetical protein